MSIYKEKYGFVYIWYDRKHKRYYIGCHWGYIDDGYICSSSWMKKAYKYRPNDFKRRILTNNIASKEEMYLVEKNWLSLIKFEEISPNTNHPRYYNLNITGFIPWHATEEGILSVGEKISKANKGKKFGPRDPSVGQKISEVKKEKFAQREAELGYKFHPEHRENMAKANKGRKHTEEWKRNNSARMLEEWNNGSRKRAEPKITMSLEEQSQLSSERLKDKWADPEWKENQRKRLSEGAKNRPPRSEESKQKARLAQLGKPKNQRMYNITFMDGNVIQIKGLCDYCDSNNLSISILSKAVNQNKSVPKYNIKSIKKA